MTKIKAVVVEDEKEGMKNIELKIAKYCPDVEMVAKCENGESAIAAIEKYNPDLVFLDIQLGNMTGFDVLNKLPHIHFEIIFTTAFNEYAIRAFKVNAIDYLLKPIKPNELEVAVEKVRQQLQSLGPIKRISVPISNGLRFVPIDEIVYCLADNNYAEIHLISGDKLLVTKTLKYISQKLPSDKFLRISRGAVINLDYVQSFQRSSGGLVTLSDGTDLSITQNKEEFLRRMAR